MASGTSSGEIWKAFEEKAHNLFLGIQQMPDQLQVRALMKLEENASQLKWLICSRVMTLVDRLTEAGLNQVQLPVADLPPEPLHKPPSEYPDENKKKKRRIGVKRRAKQRVDTEQPVLTEEPVEKRQPVDTEQPVETREIIQNEQPVATEEPVPTDISGETDMSVDEPVDTEQPVANQVDFLLAGDLGAERPEHQHLEGPGWINNQEELGALIHTEDLLQKEQPIRAVRPTEANTGLRMVASGNGENNAHAGQPATRRTGANGADAGRQEWADTDRVDIGSRELCRKHLHHVGQLRVALRKLPPEILMKFTNKATSSHDDGLSDQATLEAPVADAPRESNPDRLDYSRRTDDSGSPQAATNSVSSPEITRTPDGRVNSTSSEEDGGIILDLSSATHGVSRGGRGRTKPGGRVRTKPGGRGRTRPGARGRRRNTGDAAVKAGQPSGDNVDAHVAKSRLCPPVEPVCAHISREEENVSLCHAHVNDNTPLSEDGGDAFQPSEPDNGENEGRSADRNDDGTCAWDRDLEMYLLTNEEEETAADLVSPRPVASPHQAAGPSLDVAIRRPRVSALARPSAVPRELLYDNDDPGSTPGTAGFIAPLPTTPDVTHDSLDDDTVVAHTPDMTRAGTSGDDTSGTHTADVPKSPPVNLDVAATRKMSGSESDSAASTLGGASDNGSRGQTILISRRMESSYLQNVVRRIREQKKSLGSNAAGTDTSDRPSKPRRKKSSIPDSKPPKSRRGRPSKSKIHVPMTVTVTSPQIALNRPMATDVTTPQAVQNQPIKADVTEPQPVQNEPIETYVTMPQAPKSHRSRPSKSKVRSSTPPHGRSSSVDVAESSAPDPVIGPMRVTVTSPQVVLNGPTAADVTTPQPVENERIEADVTTPQAVWNEPIGAEITTPQAALTVSPEPVLQPLQCSHNSPQPAHDHSHSQSPLAGPSDPYVTLTNVPVNAFDPPGPRRTSPTAPLKEPPAFDGMSPEFPSIWQPVPSVPPQVNATTAARHVNLPMCLSTTSPGGSDQRSRNGSKTASAHPQTSRWAPLCPNNTEKTAPPWGTREPPGMSWLEDISTASEVEASPQEASAGRKRSSLYTRYTPEDRAILGKYAVKHGANATVAKFRDRLPNLAESTVRAFRAKYVKMERALSQKRGKGDEGKVEIREIPAEKRGRRLIIGEELDAEIRAHLCDVTSGWKTKLTSRFVISSVRGYLQQHSPQMLEENGGPIDINAAFANSLIVRLSPMYTHGTKPKKKKEKVTDDGGEGSP